MTSMSAAIRPKCADKRRFIRELLNEPSADSTICLFARPEIGQALDMASSLTLTYSREDGLRIFNGPGLRALEGVPRPVSRDRKPGLLNHAAVSPLCRPAANAMRHLADDALLYGSHHYDKWLDAYEGYESRRVG